MNRDFASSSQQAELYVYLLTCFLSSGAIFHSDTLVFNDNP